ncbi:heterokaryon incompatibility protein-domain-containing protein [Cercophora newfieldiana]|uniref:Heterokaryon incompatibility protein-domain-containing protein n=1 Tax=Cercophora newfieldiana TaxID=92897 RepID=A0AA39YSP2_9PEZI|nr:heterokaryon incompatibility protein-domain-containing protein [Cercophora newfieldiana]
MANPYSRPIGDDAIRLFRINTVDDGLVSVELQRFSLEGAACPPYVATSYVWGPPTYTGRVLLNGQPAQILQSALGFLKAMLSDHWREKFPPSKTWWWMDSICINQKDDEERSAQVQLMSTIYTRAKRTAIWLGEESEDSNRAMDFLHKLASRDPFVSGLDSGIAEDTQSWTAVGNLLLREWFERAWTLQEFLLSSRSNFFCGSKNISRFMMFDAVSAVWDWQQWKHDIIPRKSYERAWNRFRLLERYTHELSLPLVGTLAYTATSRVTDSRDRLYSLLGLASPIDREVVGQPDYESDPELVFARLVQSFVEKHESLDIVCLAAVLRGLRSKEALNTGYDLPSWVPDWSIELLHSGPVPSMASQSARAHIGNLRPMHSIDFSCMYAACGSMGPRVRFSEDLLGMTCGGILVDRVDGLGGVRQVSQDAVHSAQSTSAVNARPPDGGVESHRNQATSTFLWGQIPCCLVLDRKDRYLRHRAPLLDFSRQFKTLCQLAVSQPAESVPVPFMEWFQRNKDLLIRGITLEEAIKRDVEGNNDGDRGIFGQSDSSEPLQEIPGLSDWESFLSRLRDTSWTMGMRLMVTNSGLVGMAPRDAKKGDIVCVLFGCSIPLVLRSVPGREWEAYQLVGECFMAGFMNGEILETNLERMEFCVV